MTRVLLENGPDQGLPWHYGDPLGEQRHLADGSGVVDLSNREIIALHGPDSLDLLDRLGSAKLAGLPVGAAAATYLLDARGRLAYYLALVRVDPATVLGWTEPGRGRCLVDYLNRLRFRLAVTAELVPDVAVVWQGNEAIGVRHCGSGPAAVAREPYRTGLADCLGGCEVFVPRAELAAVLATGQPAGLWAYTARRIAAGRPRFGSDTDERTIPNELGVPSDEVALDKGCYPGQETVAKVHTIERAAKSLLLSRERLSVDEAVRERTAEEYNLGVPPRRLVRLLLDGSEERWLEPGRPIQSDGKTVGRAGSMAYHYELGPIALGLVDQRTDDNATVDIDGLTATIEPIVLRQTVRCAPPVTSLQRMRLL